MIRDMREVSADQDARRQFHASSSIVLLKQRYAALKARRKEARSRTLTPEEAVAIAREVEVVRRTAAVLERQLGFDPIGAKREGGGLAEALAALKNGGE